MGTKKVAPPPNNMRSVSDNRTSKIMDDPCRQHEQIFILTIHGVMKLRPEPQECRGYQRHTRYFGVVTSLISEMLPMILQRKPLLMVFNKVLAVEATLQSASSGASGCKSHDPTCRNVLPMIADI